MKKNLLAFVTLTAVTFSINAQNLINDGEFATDGVLGARTESEWGMWSGNGATVEVIDGVCVAKPIASADNWNCQVEQWNEFLDNDSTYTLKFKTWAAADRNITITIEDPANGYKLLGITPDEDGEKDAGGGANKSKWTVAITTVPTVYTKTVTIKNIVDNTTIKFAFLLSETSDIVNIDNVSLTLVPAKPNAISTTVKQGFNVFPNPAKDVLTISGNNGKVVNIFDLTGKLVLKSSLSKIDISSMTSGVYMVKSGSETKKLIVK